MMPGNGDLVAIVAHTAGMTPARPGADAWRATTYGHGALQTNPLGSALE